MVCLPIRKWNSYDNKPRNGKFFLDEELQHHELTATSKDKYIQETTIKKIVGTIKLTWI